MVTIMMKQLKLKRVISVFLALLFAVMLLVPTTLPASAANRRFITELRVEAGEEAVAALEEDGWSVTMVGLNVTADPASQVYLAYKMNTGSPITNVIVSPDVGDSLTDKNGVVYNCVSHVDVNEGILRLLPAANSVPMKDIAAHAGRICNSEADREVFGIKIILSI